jgi:hypothetical protein
VSEQEIAEKTVDLQEPLSLKGRAESSFSAAEKIVETLRPTFLPPSHKFRGENPH